MSPRTSDSDARSVASGGWTVGRILLIILWLGFTLAVGFVLLTWTWFKESEIAYGITKGNTFTLPLLVFATACAWAAGPLTVWITRRTRPWLVATAALAVLGLATAVPKHPAERVQDDIRAIPVPASWKLELEEVDGYGAPLFGERDSATRIFTSSSESEQTCVEARTSLFAWAKGSIVEEREVPPELAHPCDLYVARDGTLVALIVYDRAGWEGHDAVMNYDVTYRPDTLSFIELSTTDSNG